MNFDDSIVGDIKVSICVVAFNHVEYLRECLDSLVGQDVNFNYEIIVGDDGSTDGTATILREYSDKYPDMIIPIFHQKNIGPVGNYFSVHGLARGQYVCHMDGDDLAFPKKLQTQSDFLDANSNVNICWHRMNMFDVDGVDADHPAKNSKFVGMYVVRQDLLLFGPFGSHSSMMYRRENFSRKYEHFEALDWILSVELIGSGFGVILEDVLGRYRLHSAGVSVAAVPNDNNRKWLCNCQLKLLTEYPQFSSVIALRALMLFLLDFLGGRTFYRRSLTVFLSSKSFPNIILLPKLLDYYKNSKLPKVFFS